MKDLMSKNMFKRFLEQKVPVIRENEWIINKILVLD